MGFRLRAHSIVILAFAASGCAYSYVDAEHNRHVIGMLDITTPPASAQPVTSVTLTTVGLSVYRQSGSDSAISLGYNQQTVVSLPNNACLDLARSSVCAASSDSKGAPQP